MADIIVKKPLKIGSELAVFGRRYGRIELTPSRLDDAMEPADFGDWTGAEFDVEVPDVSAPETASA